MMKRIFILLIICSLSASFADAQTIRDYVRRGNRLMCDTVGGKDYSDKAIIQYKKALEIDSTYSIARYNLGTALVRQGKPQEAMKEFLAAIKYEKDKKNLSDIYHNMGVLLQASQKYSEAVESYKESLRNNPSNNETRYNYVLALWHLKNQSNQNDQQDKSDDQQQKDQEKQQDKQQDQQGKDKKEQPQPQENKEDKQQQQQQPAEQKDAMSKENAERILKAAMRNEKENQEKIQRQQQDAPRRRLLKQW